MKGLQTYPRYTWATDYHLVVTDYLQRLVNELKTTAQMHPSLSIAIQVPWLIDIWRI